MMVNLALFNSCDFQRRSTQNHLLLQSCIKCGSPEPCHPHPHTKCKLFVFYKGCLSIVYYMRMSLTNRHRLHILQTRLLRDCEILLSCPYIVVHPYKHAATSSIIKRMVHCALIPSASSHSTIHD